ncbi:MAG: hypothetical protein P8Z70_12220, partial [Desulfuromonadales bacterium]
HFSRPPLEFFRPEKSSLKALKIYSPQSTESTEEKRGNPSQGDSLNFLGGLSGKCLVSPVLEPW